MQEYIRQKYSSDVKYNYERLSDSDEIQRFANSKMDTFSDSMIDYFAMAIEKYKASIQEKYGAQVLDPWVLFVVENKERNVVDQKFIETEL